MLHIAVWNLFCFVWKKLFTAYLLIYAVLLEDRKSFFVGFGFCFFIFYLCSLYQELVLSVFLKIIYITVIDYVFWGFLTVQVKLLRVNVWNLVRAYDNRIYGANPRDMFTCRVCELNQDTTEIRGSLPVH